MTSHYVNSTRPWSPTIFAGSSDVTISEYTAQAPLIPEQRVFADWHLAHGLPGGPVPAGTPLDGLASLIGFVHKLEPVPGPGPRDWRYRIYGNRVAEAANIDLQDKLVSTDAGDKETAFLDHYADVSDNPRLFLGEVTIQGAGIAIPKWYRAVTPMADRAGRVTALIALCFPA